MATVVHEGNGAGAVGGKARRAKAILSFASDLQRRLPTDKDDTAAVSALINALQTQLRTLDNYSRKPNHGMHGDEDMDAAGTNLWNLCTRLNREEADKPSSKAASKSSKLVLHSRVFAFQILNLCQWTDRSKPPVIFHLMRLALKVAKHCIDDDDVHTARLVLTRAADYNGQLHKLSQTMAQDDANDCSELLAEFLVMRTALAWRENQLDVAEHMFSQADDLLERLQPKSTEKVADVLYDMGKGLLSREDFPMAVKWLERAWDVINGQQLQDLPRDAVELRVAILQALVTALLGCQTIDSIAQAQNLVKYVESEVGDRPFVLLLNLEVLNKSPAEVFDADTYANILKRMIRSFRPAESSFKMLVHYIRKLHDKSPGLGCKVLDEFLVSQIKSGHDQWIDSLVVHRMWMTTNQRDFAGTVEDAQKALERLEKPVGSDATFAAQTLIWKRLESNYNQGQLDLAEKWCQLALSPAFSKSGPMNIAKLERKLLLCAIARNDLEAAKSAFYLMTETTQKEHMTQYLMYKAAVRSGDRDLASECLEAVAQASNTTENFLYACVAESQHVGDRLIAIEAMKKLCDAYSVDRPGPIHLPALLRSTLMLLHSILDSDEARQKDTVMDICEIFDGVVSAIKKTPKDKDGNILFDVKELEWFCQNAYNLGLKHTVDWDLGQVVRILSACTKIIDNFPGDIASAMAGDLSLKSIFCNFLISSALLARARAQDNYESSLQDYLDMRKHIAAFDAELQTRLEGLDEVASEDLLNKLAILLAFDFEAAVALKKWDELGEIVRKAVQCQNLEAFKTMADCILRGHAPTQELFSSMRKIINGMSELEEYDPAKLAKYTRCLIHAILPYDEELGGQLMVEACMMAGDALGSPAAWPTEELEWMATTAYNQSIDFFGRQDHEACKWWASKALSLAHHCNDGGHLETLLQDRWVTLRLDN